VYVSEYLAVHLISYQGYSLKEVARNSNSNLSDIQYTRLSQYITSIPSEIIAASI
jgi:hypothetical protein